MWAECLKLPSFPVSAARCHPAILTRWLQVFYTLPGSATVARNWRASLAKVIHSFSDQSKWLPITWDSIAPASANIRLLRVPGTSLIREKGKAAIAQNERVAGSGKTILSSVYKSALQKTSTYVIATAAGRAASFLML